MACGASCSRSACLPACLQERSDWLQEPPASQDGAAKQKDDGDHTALDNISDLEAPPSPRSDDDGSDSDDRKDQGGRGSGMPNSKPSLGGSHRRSQSSTWSRYLRKSNEFQLRRFDFACVHVMTCRVNVI